METSSNRKETVADNQALEAKKKLQNIFGHLDPTDPPKVCPIRDILASVTDKWSILIIIFLGIHEVLRFNQLKKNIYGISSKMLSERLKNLERDAYVSRQMYTEVPIRVEYSLTPFGYSYLGQLMNLTEWIEMAMPEVVKKRHKFDEIMKKGKKS